jgi:hypothetical protein
MRLLLDHYLEFMHDPENSWLRKVGLTAFFGYCFVLPVVLYLAALVHWITTL